MGLPHVLASTSQVQFYQSVTQFRRWRSRRIDHATPQQMQRGEEQDVEIDRLVALPGPAILTDRHALRVSDDDALGSVLGQELVVCAVVAGFAEVEVARAGFLELQPREEKVFGGVHADRDELDAVFIWPQGAVDEDTPRPRAPLSPRRSGGVAVGPPVDGVTPAYCLAASRALITGANLSTGIAMGWSSGTARGRSTSRERRGRIMTHRPVQALLQAV